MIFIVGGKGLTGSSIVKQAQKKNLPFAIIQKENREAFWGRHCDILIFANGNALKGKANLDPLFDFNASVGSVAEYVHKIDYGLFVFLSTVDVYDQKSSEAATRECQVIRPESLDPYGFHKWMAENYVRHFCKNHLIFRLAGLVGEGLRKNPVYDFVHAEKKVVISPESLLNFVPTRLVAEAVFKIVETGIRNETFNVASKNSIRMSDIGKIFPRPSPFAPPPLPLQNYQIHTGKIQRHVALTTSQEAVREYVESLGQTSNANPA